MKKGNLFFVATVLDFCILMTGCTWTDTSSGSYYRYNTGYSYSGYSLTTPHIQPLNTTLSSSLSSAQTASAMTFAEAYPVIENGCIKTGLEDLLVFPEPAFPEHTTFSRLKPEIQHSIKANIIVKDELMRTSIVPQLSPKHTLSVASSQTLHKFTDNTASSVHPATVTHSSILPAAVDLHTSITNTLELGLKMPSPGTTMSGFNAHLLD